MITIDLNAITATVKATPMLAGHRARINGLMRQAKGHLAVVKAYDNGGDVLAAAHKVGALPEDYQGLGRAEHADEVEVLASRIMAELDNAKTQFAKYGNC